MGQIPRSIERISSYYLVTLSQTTIAGAFYNVSSHDQIHITFSEDGMALSH